jgi:tetratricopeptide (TPR) repeat protein
LFLALLLFASLKEPIRVTTGHFRQTGIYVAVCVLAVMAALAAGRAQSQESAGAAMVQGTLQGTVQGYVRDSSGRPVANATVFLQLATGTETLATQTRITHTDSEGAYRFAALREGAYTLHAEMNGYGGPIVGPVSLAPKETRKIDLALVSTKASGPQNALPATAATEKPGARAPEFFDEPQFTVAGVTQATNSGGHGSDIVLRTTEALAKATVSLSKESAGSSRATLSAATESSLRDAVARDPENVDANRRLGKLLVDNGKSMEGVPYLERAARLNPGDDDNSYELALAYADAGNPEHARAQVRALLLRQDKTHQDRPELHHLLGDVEEKLGNPLEAVREYQRAAELDPSEPDLFDWGTELLTHRALQPATEVFTKGNRMFPRSVRMLVALGVAWYARGSYDQAAQCLANASDLAPDNPTPYLFLGRMQSVETTPSAGSVERLARFAQLQPDNALANYYYAVGLWKQSAGSVDSERSARVESLLQKAVHLDPKLGAAYLQLGILYSQREDFSRAISAYQKAIEVSPELDVTLEETHYRLAQAYRRTGDRARAHEQLQLHDQLSKKTKEDSERERRQIQEFVISLRGKDSASQPQP